ncbi:hypothetical protein HHK36_018427 [Tetracentron sinense]|uniref:Scarecrow-like protein 14 n=1 Tax=Tetracentron sinense TaxID=13715 RepID=A0A834YVU9_TETSI|nr:hypothetical protein HHK36_018427 [Tetracentron sinense]
MDPPLPPDSNLAPSSSSLSHDGDLTAESDFSDTVLKYISQMLMEEDMEEKSCMFQESLALQIAEKSFYEILGEKYPSSVPHQPSSYLDLNTKNPINTVARKYRNYNSSSNLVDPIFDLGENKSYQSKTLPVDYSTSQSTLQPSLISVDDLSAQNQSLMQFRKGVEEARKFLPNCSNLFVDLENNEPFPWEPKEEADGSRGRKNHHREDIDIEERRSSKQSAAYTEETLRSEMLDMVLLYDARKEKENSNSPLKEEKLKRSDSGKSFGKKHGGKREMVDLRTLLIQCSQAVAANDHGSAKKLLNQIRENSSPHGDGSQRLAHYFADGLEARLTGAGTRMYVARYVTRTSSADILKAYLLLLTVCPFNRLANFFSNQTIRRVAEKATRLHIIDFGILHGFQFPCLIQRLSARPGGPPNLRITGIEFPQPGFRPAAGVEETGRRLANYAKRFNVPFEFNAVAQRWETIKIEDLKIEENEVLVVNCLYRFRNLLDESVLVDCPRNIVLNLIRKLNPDVFIHAVVNGTYSAPFFVTRFREALFHYSALFDIFETNAARENKERMVLEREIFGREAMNVIACEGSERVERPETYKQWQARNVRAGFRQLPLNQEVMKMARDRVSSGYHKDFLIDEDSEWMLQGWKGRIIYALSSWKPVLENCHDH